MIRVWKLTPLAAPRGFIRRATLTPRRQISKTWTNCWRSLRELEWKPTNVARDFVARWLSHVKVRYLASLKELSKEQLSTQRVARTDSVTIRSLCRMDSKRLSVNCPPN